MKKIKVGGLVMSRKEAIEFYMDVLIGDILDEKNYSLLYHILVECDKISLPIKNWSNQQLETHISRLFEEARKTHS